MSDCASFFIFHYKCTSVEHLGRSVTEGQRESQRYFEKQSRSLMSWMAGMQRNLGITGGICRCSLTQQRRCSNNNWSREKSHFVLTLWHRNMETLRLEETSGGCPVLWPVGLWPQSTHFFWIGDSLLGSLSHLQLFPISQWMFVPRCSWEGHGCVSPPDLKVLYLGGGLMSKWVMWTDVKMGIIGSQMDEGGNWILKKYMEFLKIDAKFYTNFSNITTIVFHL